MKSYEGSYIKGSRVYKLIDLVVGKLYILHSVHHDITHLIKITEAATNSSVTYNIINPDTGKRGIWHVNDFDFTLWDFNLEPYASGEYGHIVYEAISPVRKMRTFALIVSYGIRWYGDGEDVRRIFFAKHNPADHDDSTSNFYYRDQITTSSMLRFMRLMEAKKYPLAHPPHIKGARLWDKDMPDDEGATPYCRMPSVDLSFDVPY